MGEDAFLEAQYEERYEVREPYYPEYDHEEDPWAGYGDFEDDDWGPFDYDDELDTEDPPF